jgi:hypothetical protein
MSQSAAKRAKSRRNFLVIAGLLSSLTLTSILLLVLAPSPLLPEPRSLMVVESKAALDEIFDTQIPIQPRRWQTIFIHHSKTRRLEGYRAGVPDPQGDHFVIAAAGDGADGEIRIDPRWNNQQSAVPAGGSVAANCITICLVGDFDQAAPSAMQLRATQQLVQNLQRRLHIPARNVIAYDKPNSAGGLGRQFPVRALRDSLLP